MALKVGYPVAPSTRPGIDFQKFQNYVSGISSQQRGMASANRAFTASSVT